MALAYIEALRHAQLDEITAQAGASALLRIYDGSRPATGGAATTLLAELTCNATFAPAASGGDLTLNAIADDTSADATGTATWFRIVQSDGSTHVMDGDVGTSGSDLNLNSVSIVTGGTVEVTSFVITAGNA
jgi:hypothetical protein